MEQQDTKIIKQICAAKSPRCLTKLINDYGLNVEYPEELIESVHFNNTHCKQLIHTTNGFNLEILASSWDLDANDYNALLLRDNMMINKALANNHLTSNIVILKLIEQTSHPIDIHLMQKIARRRSLSIEIVDKLLQYSATVATAEMLSLNERLPEPAYMHLFKTHQSNNTLNHLIINTRTPSTTINAILSSVPCPGLQYRFLCLLPICHYKKIKLSLLEILGNSIDTRVRGMTSNIIDYCSS